MSKNCFDTRHSDIRRRFLFKVRDFTVINNDCVSGGSDTETLGGQIDRVANGLRKCGISVRSKDDFVAGVAAEGFSPGSLNKWIVGRKNNDLINALGFELGNLLDIRRNVVGGTSGSESSGDGDNYYLFGRKLLVGIIDNRNAAGCLKCMSQFVC